jgi:hypothetical protein
MDRALWLLIGLRFKSWWRRMGRMLQSVKGIVLGLLGLLVFVPWLVSLFLGRGDRAGDPEGVRRYGALALLAYAVLQLAVAPAERAIAFSPAEVSLLFPAPFTRRQLLGYKMVVTGLTVVLSALFLALVFRVHAHFFFAAFVGVVEALWFTQLLAMVIALFAATVERLTYDRTRRIVLLVAVALVAAAAVRWGRFEVPPGWGEFVDAVNGAPVLAVLLAPLHWFVRAFTAERLWPDLALWGGLGLTFDGAWAALVLALDAQYLEASAAASERLYARLQRMRRGGLAGQWTPGKKARLGLPTFPWWRGAGPVAWRQMVAALRSFRSLGLILVLFAAVALWPLIVKASSHGAVDTEAVGAAAGTVLALTVIMVPSMVTFDFRGDVDRMDVLKSLPVARPWLVVGQLATPVLVVAALQLGLVAAVSAAFGRAAWLVAAAAAFALPVDFLVLEMENLVFLLFPTRQTPGTPADFQFIGRHLLLWLLKLVGVGVVAGAAALAGVGVQALTGQRLAAWTAAWLVVLAAAAVLVFPVAWAFDAFDVSRDTPP